MSSSLSVFSPFCAISVIHSVISIFTLLLWGSPSPYLFYPLCHATFPCVCLFALSVAELARLSQFLHLILQEMTMLQLAAIVSHIKALKLNLAKLEKNILGFYRVLHLCISLTPRCQKGLWDSALCVCACMHACACVPPCLLASTNYEYAT